MFNVSGSASKSKQSFKRVAPTTSQAQAKPTLDRYQKAVDTYLDTPAGLSSSEKGNYKAQASRAIAGTKRGESMRSKQRSTQRGYRGATDEANQARLAQYEMMEQRQANIMLSLAEQAIEESDFVSRAAVGAGYAWPYESSRGAGKVSSITSRSQSGSAGYGFTPSGPAEA